MVYTYVTMTYPEANRKDRAKICVLLSKLAGLVHLRASQRTNPQIPIPLGQQWPHKQPMPCATICTCVGAEKVHKRDLPWSRSSYGQKTGGQTDLGQGTV